ncbi:VOC family protein [Nocardioides sp.]|uniref:VOC family protein n=1 Tax=Nocardioides sp. TaxID=35761 RepID=UPI0027288524|nr:VOC family protein [Nocardioides sp.]MDO9457626.1 VOC family protein [Nocardioides sp.]
MTETQTDNPFVFFDLRTTDLGPTRAFYEAMFGWRVEEVRAGEQTLSFLAGEDGPWAGFTELPEDDDRSPQWIPYVPVADVDEAKTRAVNRGASVVRDRTELPQGSLVVVTDPGGAALVLWQDRVA